MNAHTRTACGPSWGRLSLARVLATLLGLLSIGFLMPAPAANAAGPGQYSAPEYWPLRVPTTLSCTKGNPGCVFADGAYHPVWALDIGVDRHTPIFAAGAGQVIEAVGNQGGNCSPTKYSLGNCPNGYTGNYVKIDHGSGRYSYYTHMTTVLVAKDAWVDQNTQIGTVGDSGYSDTDYTHLHFERIQGTSSAYTNASIDPVPLRACVSGVLKTYPQELSPNSWASWGSVPRYTLVPAGSLAGCSQAPGPVFSGAPGACAVQGCALVSMSNGRYVSAELSRTGDGYGEMRARSTAIGAWEQFVVVGDCSSAAGCALQSKANSKYVTAEITRTGDGYGTLRARSSTIGAWERLGLVGDCSSGAGCGLQFKANGAYVTAEISRAGDGYGTLRARADGIGAWEKFQLVALPTAPPPPPPPATYNPCSAGCGIRSTANSKLVAAELSRTGDGYGELRARSDVVSGWESFVFEGDCTSTTGCAIKNTLNGKYVSAEISRTGDGYGTLRAHAATIGTWERFGLVGNCAVAPGCAIQSKANGKYVSAEISRTGDGYGTLRARSDTIGGWERYLVVIAAPPAATWTEIAWGPAGTTVGVFSSGPAAGTVARIGVGTSISVSCRLYNQAVALSNSGGWWYRLASGTYTGWWTPASVYENGDGPYPAAGHVVDSAIAIC